MMSRMSQESKAKAKVEVSSEFIKCYEYFNVCDVSSNIKLLDRRELYLLLVLCVDKHDDANAIVINNFKEFRDEVSEILELQENENTDNQIILDLMKETGDNTIEIDDIVCFDGTVIREPFTVGVIRDIKIDGIID